MNDKFKKHDVVRFFDKLADKHLVGNIEFKARDFEDSWSVYVPGHGRKVVSESALEMWHEPGTR